VKKEKKGKILWKIYFWFIILLPFSAITLSILFLKEEVHFTIFVGTFLTLWAVKILNNITIFKKKSPKTT